MNRGAAQAGAAAAALAVGQMAWTAGSNEFGDDRLGGMVVEIGCDASTGERWVVLLTETQTRPKRKPHVYVHHQDGRRRAAYENLGPVAHLVRVPASGLDSHATDGFRHASQVRDYARAALFAAAVAMLPDYFNPRRHDELLTTYRTLRDTAQLLERGVE